MNEDSTSTNKGVTSNTSDNACRHITDQPRYNKNNHNKNKHKKKYNKKSYKLSQTRSICDSRYHSICSPKRSNGWSLKYTGNWSKNNNYTSSGMKYNSYKEKEGQVNYNYNINNSNNSKNAHFKPNTSSNGNFSNHYADSNFNQNFNNTSNEFVKQNEISGSSVTSSDSSLQSNSRIASEDSDVKSFPFKHNHFADDNRKCSNYIRISIPKLTTTHINLNNSSSTITGSSDNGSNKYNKILATPTLQKINKESFPIKSKNEKNEKAFSSNPSEFSKSSSIRKSFSKGPNNYNIFHIDSLSRNPNLTIENSIGSHIDLSTITNDKSVDPRLKFRVRRLSKPNQDSETLISSNVEKDTYLNNVLSLGPSMTANINNKNPKAISSKAISQSKDNSLKLPINQGHRQEHESPKIQVPEINKDIPKDTKNTEFSEDMVAKDSNDISYLAKHGTKEVKSSKLLLASDKMKSANLVPVQKRFRFDSALKQRAAASGLFINSRKKHNAKPFNILKKSKDDASQQENIITLDDDDDDDDENSDSDLASLFGDSPNDKNNNNRMTDNFTNKDSIESEVQLGNSQHEDKASGRDLQDNEDHSLDHEDIPDYMRSYVANSVDYMDANSSILEFQKRIDKIAQAQVEAESHSQKSESYIGDDQDVSEKATGDQLFVESDIDHSDKQEFLKYQGSIIKKFDNPIQSPVKYPIEKGPTLTLNFAKSFLNYKPSLNNSSLSLTTPINTTKNNSGLVAHILSSTNESQRLDDARQTVLSLLNDTVTNDTKTDFTDRNIRTNFETKSNKSDVGLANPAESQLKNLESKLMPYEDFNKLTIDKSAVVKPIDETKLAKTNEITTKIAGEDESSNIVIQGHKNLIMNDDHMIKVPRTTFRTGKSSKAFDSEERSQSNINDNSNDTEDLILPAKRTRSLIVYDDDDNESDINVRGDADYQKLISDRVGVNKQCQTTYFPNDSFKDDINFLLEERNKSSKRSVTKARSTTAKPLAKIISPVRLSVFKKSKSFRKSRSPKKLKSPKNSKSSSSKSKLIRDIVSIEKSKSAITYNNVDDKSDSGSDSDFEFLGEVPVNTTKNLRNLTIKKN